MYDGRVKIASTGDVIARIERAAREAPGGVVATDCDGTVWSGDVGEDLFEAFAERGRVEPPAAEALARAAASFGLDASGDGTTLVRRIRAAYLRGGLDEEKTFELMAWCFAGWSRGDVAAFAREVVAEKRVSSRIHPELARVLDRVRELGIEIYLVSASPRAIVEAGGALVAAEPARVVAVTPLWKGAGEGAGSGDRMLADVERPIPYGPGKVTGLRARIGERVLYAAFGDNAYDVAMLERATVPVAVRPKPRLRDRAGDVPNMLELAPE
jgi:phosphoserine phosphatase